MAADLNAPEFYVGAAAVQADDVYTGSGASDQTATGWKVIAGLQPLHFLGAELQYTDLGSGGFSGMQGFIASRGTWGGNATGFFAVGYLPLRLPYLDIFAKVGGQRTHTTAEGFAGPYCPPGAFCPKFPTTRVHVSETETDFAYGAGVQAKLRSFAVRVDYERTNTSLGNPRLLSLGLTYTF